MSNVPARISTADMQQMLVRDDDGDAAHPSGLTPLHVACALGDCSVVKKHIHGLDNVNARTLVDVLLQDHVQLIRAGSTPLHVAVLFRHERVARLLLKESANINAPDSRSFTPLHLTMPHDRSMARALIRGCPTTTTISARSVSATGLTHLHVAVWADEREAVKRLLAYGADMNALVGTELRNFPLLQSAAGKSPILLAVESSSWRAVEALLKHRPHNVLTMLLSLLPDAQPSAERYRRKLDSAGVTLLHAACASCDIAKARSLLEDEADVDARIREGQLAGATPLSLVVDEIEKRIDDVACSLQDCCNIVELLVECGADVTVGHHRSTPLCLLYRYAVHRKNADPALLRVADLLLKSQKSYAKNPRDRYGFSHFHFACVRNDVETATKFLDHGADVNRPTRSHDARTERPGGSTPLHFAVAYESRDVARLLLERGADVGAKDANGDTPLHIALFSR